MVCSTVILWLLQNHLCACCLIRQLIPVRHGTYLVKALEANEANPTSEIALHSIQP